MAENKKSFVLYADLIHIVREMPMDKAGELFLTILSYVNDENPKVDDLLVKIAFEPIKLQMKRDLVKWEAILQKRSNAGKASAEARRIAKELEEKNNNSTNSTHVESVEHTSTNSTVNDNVTVTVTDTVINNKESGDKSPTPSKSSNLKNTLPDRKEKFKNSLAPFLETYGKDMLNKFYLYWTELNKSKTKMKWELQETFEVSRRLSTWASRENEFSNKGKKQEPTEVRVRKSEVNGSN